MMGNPGWLRTAGVALITAALATLAGTHAMGTVASRHAPDQALAVMPHNGEAYAQRSIAAFQTEARAGKGKVAKGSGSAFARDAARAFALEPLSVKAIRQQALALEADGRQEQASRLMLAASALSHRDDLTNLWLIDWYLRQDNVDKALRHYDIALRTSDLGAAILMPKLALALRNDTMLEPMVGMLGRRPEWSRRYWFAVAETPVALPNAAKLRMIMADRGISIGDDLDARLMRELTARGHFDAAQAMYARLTGRKSDSRLIMSRADLAQSAAFAPFDWTSGLGGGQSGYVNPQDRTLELSGGPGSRGVAAYRIAALDPGDYAVGITFEPAEGPQLTLQVICALAPRDATPLAQFAAASGRISGQFSADGTCRFYKFSLILAVPANGSSTVAEMTDISLRKL